MSMIIHNGTFLRRGALLPSFALLLLLVCCAKTSTNNNSDGNTAQSNTAPTPATNSNESSGDQNATHREPSLVSLSTGAFPVKAPPTSYVYTSSVELLDERPKSCWRSVSGATPPQVFVIALPERTVLKSLEFDCAYDLFNKEGACAKDVSVEMSDTNENDGYQKIADVPLKEGADNQRFAVSSEIPGRWIRLTLKNNHGSKDYFQLNDFRAYGTQLTHTPFPDVSGTYDSNLGEVHLRQEGTSVSGCYSYLGRSDNTFDGGVESRVIKLDYCRYCSDASKVRGPGILVFSPDGQRFTGLYFQENSALNDYGGEHWEGTRKSTAVGTCPQWAGGIEEQLTKDLEEFGRARVYGINFDTDSDRIKDESKPTLDKIVAMLKAKPDWKLTIEGHTDSTSTPQHNQDLSERRAASVKNYLQSAGIDGSRLKTVGYGATKPVASNDTELGRAQNRRVELAKQ